MGRPAVAPAIAPAGPVRPPRPDGRCWHDRGPGHEVDAGRYRNGHDCAATHGTSASEVVQSLDDQGRPQGASAMDLVIALIHGHHQLVNARVVRASALPADDAFG